MTGQFLPGGCGEAAFPAVLRMARRVRLVKGTPTPSHEVAMSAMFAVNPSVCGVSDADAEETFPEWLAARGWLGDNAFGLLQPDVLAQLLRAFEDDMPPARPRVRTWQLPFGECDHENAEVGLTD
jgi:hypothetical protein